MNTLAYAHLRARIVCEPEYAHPSWNNVLMAVKKAGLQPAVLIVTLMSHTNHGPYSSGKTMAMKQEICEAWVSEMSDEEWEQLREDIAHDRGVEVDHDLVPSNKEDLLREPTIASRGIFAPSTELETNTYRRFNSRISFVGNFV